MMIVILRSLGTEWSVTVYIFWYAFETHFVLFFLNMLLVFVFCFCFLLLLGSKIYYYDMYLFYDNSSPFCLNNVIQIYFNM